MTRPRLRLVRSVQGGRRHRPVRGNAENGGRLLGQLPLDSRSVARVSLSPSAAREYEGLPLSIRGRVLAIFERLSRWPEVSGAKPMRGELAGLYRIRTGDYRVLFRIEGEHVRVERIGHRDRFYED